MQVLALKEQEYDLLQTTYDTFIFLQDNALSYRKLLQQEMPDFIGPYLWPPNSPDLNPVDYKVWDVMQQLVYECHINSVSDLKQCLVEVWNSLQQNIKFTRPSMSEESD